MASNARLWLIVLLLAVSLLPGVSGAPSVLPTSSSVLSVNGAVDYFEFAGGAGGTSATWQVTAPDGASASFQEVAIGSMCSGIRVRFYLGSSTPDAASGCSSTIGARWLYDGSLSNHLADGTWTIALSPTGAYSSHDGTQSSPSPTLSVGGKAIHFGVRGTTAPDSNFQSWNWRSTCAGCTWSEPVHAVGSTDGIAEAADEDPNNAVFFNDAAPPGVSPFTAYTLNYGTPSSCTTTPTDTVNGAWIGATGTTFSQFIYRDGNFVGTTDLRAITDYQTTTEENEGSTGSGTDAKSIGYSNFAGTSYQFKVRDSTGERLGAVQWIPNGLCTATTPSLASLVHDENEFQISASQAQCDGDFIAFEITLYGAGAGSGLTASSVTLYEAQTGTPRVTVPSTAMHAEGTFPNIVWSFRTVAPAGAYVATATADLTGGLGVKDFFDTVAFNVPRGPCTDTPTDLSPVLVAIQDTRENLTGYLDHVNTHLHAITAQVAAFQANQTTYLNHVNAHLHNIEVTQGEVLDAIANLNVTIVGNVTGNFTVDDATLSAIYNEILQHRANSLELMTMNDFAGLGFDGFLFASLWIIALWIFLRNAKLISAAAATIGLLGSIMTNAEWFHILAIAMTGATFWLEAIARERLYSRWISNERE